MNIHQLINTLKNLPQTMYVTTPNGAAVVQLACRFIDELPCFAITCERGAIPISVAMALTRLEQAVVDAQGFNLSQKSLSVIEEDIEYPITGCYVDNHWGVDTVVLVGEND